MGGCWYLLVGGIPNIGTATTHSTSTTEDKPNTTSEIEQDVRSDTVLLQRDMEQPNYHTYVRLYFILELYADGLWTSRILTLVCLALFLLRWVCPLSGITSRSESKIAT